MNSGPPKSFMERSAPRRSAWSITLAYIAIGILWIVVSDIVSLGVDAERLTPELTISMIKGIFWIVASGLLLHILVFKRIERARTFERAVQRRLLEGEEIGRFGIAESFAGETRARWSEGMFRLWGRSPEQREPDAEWLAAHIDPPDLDRARAAADAAARGESVEPYEIGIRAEDGAQRYLRITTKAEDDGGRVRTLVLAQDVTEVRALERNAAQSLGLLRSVLESSAEGIIVVRADTRELLLWNERFLELTHVPRQVMERLDARVAVAELVDRTTKQEQVHAWIEEIYRNPEAECVDLIEMKDGTLLERHTAPVFIEGEPRARIWSFRDLTERIRAEERFRATFEQAAVGIAHLSLDGVVIRANETLGNALRMERDEIIGTVAATLIHPDDRTRAAHEVEALLRGEPASRTWELRFLAKGGESRWAEVTVSAARLEAGPSYLIAVAQDITERKTLEEEQAKLARQVKLLLASTEAGLFTADLQGRCTLINRAALEALGYAEDEILGQNICDSVYGREANVPLEADAAIEKANAGEATKLYNHRFVRRDGTTLPVDITVSPIFDGGGVIGRAVSFVDVSDRMRLEEQLEEAKRLSGLGRLAASVAHEINNVLMGILPFAEIVTRSKEQIFRNAGEQIRQSVQRGRGVTQEILRFARDEVPQRQVFEGRAWLRSVAGELQGIAGSRAWSLTIPSEPFYLDADPPQLAQVLINLVVNARDAADPESGRIELAIDLASPGTTYSFGALPNRGHRWIAIRVTDNGVGMDADTLRHLFEPFFTMKRGGTGLGLPIAYKIVAAHEGLMFVESTEGRGSSFYVFVPEAAAPESEQPEETAGESHLSGDVLLVEDDETVAAGLFHVLEDSGMRVRLARTGAEALATLEHARPSVVVLDVGLPDIHGEVVCEKALARWPELPIVFSTGHADASRLGAYLEKPNVRFLMKPYTFEQLSEAIEQARNGG